MICLTHFQTNVPPLLCVLLRSNPEFTPQLNYWNFRIISFGLSRSGRKMPQPFKKTVLEETEWSRARACDMGKIWSAFGQSLCIWPCYMRKQVLSQRRWTCVTMCGVSTSLAVYRHGGAYKKSADLWHFARPWNSFCWIADASIVGGHSGNVPILWAGKPFANRPAPSAMHSKPPKARF